MRFNFRWITVIVCLAAALLILPAAAQDTETPPAPTLDVPTATAPEGTPEPTLSPTPVIRPTARETLTVGDAVIELYFDSIDQGGFGVLHVTGAGVTGATATWLEENIPLFPAPA